MILYLLILLLLLYIFTTCTNRRRKEGFTNESYKTFIDDNIYDNFYSKIYDELWDMIPLYTEQINIMKPYFGSNNNFLCFDSKTGHMCQLLSENMKVVGLDNSKEMIKMSKSKYPKLDFIYGNYNPSIFKNNLFTHIFCPLFSINNKDFDLFFECVDKWLVHKGYLFITTYDKLDISKFVNDSPSKSFKSNYDYNIEFNNKNLIEKITYDNKKRTNILYLNQPKLDFLTLNLNFRLINKIKIPGFFCYLNILQKY